LSEFDGLDENAYGNLWHELAGDAADTETMKNQRNEPREKRGTLFTFSAKKT
jgi:hypothetical protein